MRICIDIDNKTYLDQRDMLDLEEDDIPHIIDNDFNIKTMPMINSIDTNNITNIMRQTSDNVNMQTNLMITTEFMMMMFLII